MARDFIYFEFPAVNSNASFAQMIASTFSCHLDASDQERQDIKTAVSEAVTNCILHAYPDREDGIVAMELSIENQYTLRVVICDDGVGIPNIEEAMQPLYTTRPDLECRGMGFTFMEALMDSLEVSSGVGKGTRIIMTKIINHDSTFW